MYQAGDLIVYGTDGVCEVTEIGTPDMRYIEKGKPYYFLRPTSKTGMIYVPVDTQVFMRPVVTREMALALIDQIPDISEESESTAKNQTELSEQYKTLLKSRDCTDLLKLIKMTYAKKRTAVSQGKKPGKLDTQAMSRAEDLLHDEFSVALGIPKDDVKAFIAKRVRELGGELGSSDEEGGESA